MRPESKRERSSFEPRWRHFHPQDVLFLKNPFDEDVVFTVADERNQPISYRMPAKKVCELPGGLIATLGLKEIIDRLIGQSKTDLVRIWEPGVRKYYEDQVIIRVKEAPQKAAADDPGGPITLASSEDEADIAAADEGPHEERAFPGAKKAPAAAPPAGENKEPKPAFPGAKPFQKKPKEGDPNLANIAAASAGNGIQTIEET